MIKETLNFIQNQENLAERFARETKEWQNSDNINSVYLYGAGYLMQYYFRYLQQYGIKIAGILDTFKEGTYNQVPILRYETFLANTHDLEHCRVFISTAAASKEIIPILKRHFPKDNVFFVDWAFQLEGFDMTLNEYRCYLTEHWNEIEYLHDSLTDEKSKVTLLNILRGHISGNPNWFMASLDPDLDYPPDVISFGKNEVFVEPGANNGETFLEFVRRCPQYRAAYLFEPEACFYEKLCKIAMQEKDAGKSVYIIPKGVWDSETELSFISTEQGNGSFVLTPDIGVTKTIITTTIDATVMEPFTYMKMDIEGAEFKALRGAEKHILKYRPKLGISVYHKPTDLLDVWNYLRSLIPDYHFYLRNHTPLWDDIILYAI